MTVVAAATLYIFCLMISTGCAGQSGSDATQDSVDTSMDTVNVGGDGPAIDSQAIDSQAIDSQASADVQSADVQSADVQSADVASADVQSSDVASADVQSSDVASADVQNADVDLGTDADTTADATPDGGATACKVHTDCASETPYCDPISGACSSCLLDHQCAKDQVCLQGVCQKSTSCKGDKACSKLDAVCDKTAGQCVSCLTVSDCESGYGCKLQHCIAKPASCTTSKQCDDDEVCDKVSATCVDCVVDDDCTTAQFCNVGFCVKDVCTKATKTCLDAKTLSICSANGGAWTSKTCAANQVCDGAACVPTICTPGVKSCENSVASGGTSGGKVGGKVVVCGKKGLSWGSGLGCKMTEICQSGACVKMVCTPGESVCTVSDKDKSTMVRTCKANGMGYVDVVCGSGMVCEAAVCTTITCKANALFCVGDAVRSCNSLGTKSVLQSTCAKTKVCLQGACVAQVCTPKQTRCGASGMIETCGVSGLKWLSTSCATGSVCAGGQCAKIVCKPGSMGCKLGGEVWKCNAQGTKESKLLTCEKSKTCLKGVCVVKICTAGSSQCAGNSAKTCDATGLAWQTTDCSAQKATCVGGICKKWLCTAGSVTCQGGSSAVCAADGMSWTTSVCADGKACTVDACDKTSGKCVYTKTAACTAAHRVFVTSGTWTGLLGGVAGADAKCQSAANAAKLGGTWRAWISSRAKGPIHTFIKDGAPYRRLDGALVAKNWQDLVDGTIATGIDLTEIGTTISATNSKSSSTCNYVAAFVWTGTYSNGKPQTDVHPKYGICSNWTKQGGANIGRAIKGKAAAKNGQWSTMCVYDGCQRLGHLYCFEQTTWPK